MKPVNSPGDDAAPTIPDGEGAPAACLFPLVVCAGVLVRVLHYSLGRSMWFDEACLVLNITDRGFLDLASGLDFHQAAPIGFLWLERACCLVLGDSELALRLPVLAAGVAALLLFARIVRDELPPIGALLSVALFGLAWPLARFATEVKPYAVDALAAVVVWWLVLEMTRGALPVVASVSIGGLLVWCSYPSIFVLAGAVPALGLRAYLDHDPILLRRVLLSAVGWAASAAACFALVLSNVGSDAYFTEFWRAAFMPMPPWSGESLSWSIHTGGAVLRNTLGLPLSILAVVAAIIGAKALTGRKPWLALFLVAPLVLALGASAIGRYPFTGRFLLFAAPAMFALIGAGVGHMLAASRRGVVLAGWMIAVGLATQSVALAVVHVVRPGAKQEIEPVLEILGERATRADTVVVDGALACPYLYYRDRFGLGDVDQTVMRPSSTGVAHDPVVAQRPAVDGSSGDIWLLVSDLGDLLPADAVARLTNGGRAKIRCGEVARDRGVVLYRCGDGG